MKIPWESFYINILIGEVNMIIKVKDLQNNMMGIYKIVFPNSKIYIGLSTDIKRRMYEHNNPHSNKTPCDLAINKYGKIEEIEILELIFYS